MSSQPGITNENENPFARDAWVEQGFGLTDHRARQLEPLLNRPVELVLDHRPENTGCYVAFVAVRWGFAKIWGERLVPTEKWDKLSDYDEYGRFVGVGVRGK